MRGQRLRQCLCARQAPVDWQLDWIRIPARSAFLLAGVAFLIYGVSVARENPGWGGMALFPLGVLICVGTAAILNRRMPGKLALSVAVGSIALLNVMSSASVLLFSDPIFRARLHVRNNISFKAIPTVLGFPLVPNAALIAWSLVTDVVSLEMMSYYMGDEGGSLRMHTTSAVTALMWLGLTVLTSGRLCSIFDAQRALEAEKELLASMMTMMCDATVWLSEDCQTVLGSDHRFKMILGRDVTGEDVCDSLAEDERRRMKESLPGAKAAPVLLPTTLVTQGGARIPVEMFIVGNRHAEAGGQAGLLPAFLIGVRVGEFHVSSASAGLREGLANPLAQHQLEEAGRIALEDDQFTAPLSSAASAPETTVTGRVFERVRGSPDGQPDEMQRRLEDVLALGEQERWLLEPADLKIAASQVLGEGAYGVVVPGWLHGSPVAVKATRDSQDGAGAQHLVAIAMEIRILRHVRHPNVVLFHGACVEPEEGELVLVLERVRGPNLHDYVERHAADSEACKRFQLLLDIACALRYLHALRPQVLHGDLKGTNILVEPGLPRAKLLDFGLSRILTKRARPLGGSLPWMAPELICKRADKPSPSADVFSLGRLACMITTCKKPLAGLRSRAIVNMAQRGVTHLELWEEGKPLHSEGRALCVRLQSYEPEDRPTASEAHREISAWAPPLAGERELPELELARAADADAPGANAPVGNLSSLRRALRSGPAEGEQARRRPRAGRAGRGAAVLEGVQELERGEGAARGAAPQSAARCSL